MLQTNHCSAVSAVVHSSGSMATERSIAHGGRDHSVPNNVGS